MNIPTIDRARDAIYIVSVLLGSAIAGLLLAIGIGI